MLITGGSSGTGEATARELARWGANVVVVARRADRLQSLVTDLRNQDVRAEQISADLTETGVGESTLPHLATAAEDSPRRVTDPVMISSAAGRFARAGSAVCNATKHAIDAYSEALRQEVAQQRVRVGVIAPGQVDTELRSHNRTNVREKIATTVEAEPLTVADIAEVITFAVTPPRRVALNEVLVRPTSQIG